MDKLFTTMFGGDFLDYVYDKKRICHIHDNCCPSFVYDKEEWVAGFVEMMSANDPERGEHKVINIVLLLFVS